MEILRRNRGSFSIFKNLAADSGFGKNTKRVNFYLKAISRVFKHGVHDWRRGSAAVSGSLEDGELTSFSKETAGRSIKEAYRFFKKQNKNLEGSDLSLTTSNNKISRRMRLATEAVDRGFFGDGNNLPLTSLLSNDFSSFKKGLESMPLSLQYFYFNYLRDVEYNLNSYHFFNFTNFRSYNWLITT